MSISLVLLWHFNTVPIRGLWRVDYGNLGVRVFFVVSGFLITTLLLTDEANLRTFYARRLTRILPAFLTYVVVVALLIPTGWVAASYRDIPPTVLYLTDYIPVGLTLGATWSLSVEEQFYLLWPSVTRLGRRAALWACVAVLILSPTFRLLAHKGLWPTNPRYAFESVADALASGCLLALLRDRLWTYPLYRRLCEFALWAPVAVLGWLAFVDWGVSALNLSIAVALDRLMRQPPWILNCAPVVWLGTLSYSLYLWQQLFIGPLPFMVKVGCSLACACCSFYLVENPVRRWLNSRWTVARRRSERTALAIPD